MRRVLVLPCSGSLALPETLVHVHSQTNEGGEVGGGLISHQLVLKHLGETTLGDAAKNRVLTTCAGRKGS